MIVSVCGSRYTKNPALVTDTLESLKQKNSVIIHVNKYTGVDFITKNWCEANEVVYKLTENILENSDLLVAFLADNSKFTKKIIKDAENKNIKILVILI